MKQKTFASLIALILLAMIPFCAFAAEEMPYVIDEAGLLTSEEEKFLEEKVQALRQIYAMDIVILTIDSLNGSTSQDFSDDYFDSNGYGYGENYNGVLFLLAVEERDWYISTSGDTQQYDLLPSADEAIPYFSAGDYYTGFDSWLEELPFYLEETTPSIFLSLIIGLAAAAVSIVVMHFSMNTKRAQAGAASYMVDGSYHLRTHQDIFLYSNITKTARPKETSSGGGSTHRSSSGRSHGGGGGKF